MSKVMAAGPGAVVRQEFGAVSTQVVGETAAAAAAAYAQATVQARFIVAERRPRDMDLVRDRLVKLCSRPAFAEEAIYRKPIGDGVEGPSIRLAEAIAREMGNILVDQSLVSDDPHRRVIAVTATDLESNTTYVFMVTVEKTVDRKKADGRVILRQRKNSQGHLIYVIQAEDDEIVDKVGAAVSKAVRTVLLRLAPSDILAEIVAVCYRTMEAATIKDLAREREKVIAGFAALRQPVPRAQLSLYLGHDVGQAIAAEVVSLRALGLAIRDGETTWEQAVANQAGQAERATAPPITSEASEPVGEAVHEATPSVQPPSTDLIDQLKAEIQAVSGMREAVAVREKIYASAPEESRQELIDSLNEKMAKKT